MTTPSTGDFNLWDGSLINNTDWDANFTQVVTYLTNANYDVTFNSVTANSFVGLPTDSFSLTTGENVSAGDCIRINGGLAYKATSANEAGITSVVGVAETTVSSGNPVNVLYDFRDGYSGLTAGGIYYVGLDGAITASKPSWGMEIGTAVSASRININIKPATYTDVIDKFSFRGSLTFDTTTVQDVSKTLWGIYNSSFPEIWATQPIIDGSHKVYLRFMISGGGSLGDGIVISITNDSGSTNLYESNAIAINNLSRSAVIYLDLANAGATTLNIGSTPLNAITTNITEAGRWKVRARRSDGSSTSGEYTIDELSFVLVQQ